MGGSQQHRSPEPQVLASLVGPVHVHVAQFPALFPSLCFLTRDHMQVLMNAEVAKTSQERGKSLSQCKRRRTSEGG